jgi:hypothetical protein
VIFGKDDMQPVREVVLGKGNPPVPVGNSAQILDYF